VKLFNITSKSLRAGCKRPAFLIIKIWIFSCSRSYNEKNEL